MKETFRLALLGMGQKSNTYIAYYNHDITDLWIMMVLSAAASGNRDHHIRSVSLTEIPEPPNRFTAVKLVKQLERKNKSCYFVKEVLKNFGHCALKQNDFSRDSWREPASRCMNPC